MWVGWGEAGREAGGTMCSLKAEWDCALVAGSPLVALHLGLGILFTISRLRADVIDNNNGVQCCPPRSAAFQRY